MMRPIILILLFSLSLSNSLRAQEEEDKPHRRANYTQHTIKVASPLDSIVVYKAERRMDVYHKKQHVKTYIICLGLEPEGNKNFEGDLRTPEGLYYINDRSRKSAYHANLGVSYPNLSDSLMARVYGRSPGGEIKLHGFPNKHRKDQEWDILNDDWTLGCIAVSDNEIDELYEWVVMYCPIMIKP